MAYLIMTHIRPGEYLESLGEYKNTVLKESQWKITYISKHYPESAMIVLNGYLDDLNEDELHLLPKPVKKAYEHYVHTIDKLINTKSIPNIRPHGYLCDCKLTCKQLAILLYSLGFSDGNIQCADVELYQNYADEVLKQLRTMVDEGVSKSSELLTDTEEKLDDICNDIRFIQQENHEQMADILDYIVKQCDAT